MLSSVESAPSHGPQSLGPRSAHGREGRGAQFVSALPPHDVGVDRRAAPRRGGVGTGPSNCARAASSMDLPNAVRQRIQRSGRGSWPRSHGARGGAEAQTGGASLA